MPPTLQFQQSSIDRAQAPQPGSLDPIATARPFGCSQAIGKNLQLQEFQDSTPAEAAKTTDYPHFLGFRAGVRDMTSSILPSWFFLFERPARYAIVSWIPSLAVCRSNRLLAQSSSGRLPTAATADCIIITQLEACLGHRNSSLTPVHRCGAGKSLLQIPNLAIRAEGPTVDTTSHAAPRTTCAASMSSVRDPLSCVPEQARYGT